MTTTRKTQFVTIQVEKDTHDIIRKLGIFTKNPAHKVVKALLAKAAIIDSIHDNIFDNWTTEDHNKFVMVAKLID